MLENLKPSDFYKDPKHAQTKKINDMIDVINYINESNENFKVALDDLFETVSNIKKANEVKCNCSPDPYESSVPNIPNIPPIPPKKNNVSHNDERVDLGPDYIGFLHRHESKPGFPEMRSHVVVNLSHWEDAREFHQLYTDKLTFEQHRLIMDIMKAILGEKE